MIVGIAAITADQGLPPPDEEFFFVYLLYMITPPFTVMTLVLTRSESWLGLYFKRKAAEERRRIAEIEGDPKSPKHSARDD